MNITTIRSSTTFLRRFTLASLALFAAFLLAMTAAAPAHARLVLVQTSKKAVAAVKAPKVATYTYTNSGCASDCQTAPAYSAPEASLAVSGVYVSCAKQDETCTVVIDAVGNTAKLSKESFPAPSSQYDVSVRLYGLSIMCQRKNAACDAGISALFGFQQQE